MKLSTLFEAYVRVIDEVFELAMPRNNKELHSRRLRQAYLFEDKIRERIAKVEEQDD